MSNRKAISRSRWTSARGWCGSITFSHGRRRVTAGVATDRIEVVDAWGGAIDRAVGGVPAGGELVVLATYTAMLALRGELARRGHVAPFWED